MSCGWMRRSCCGTIPQPRKRPIPARIRSATATVIPAIHFHHEFDAGSDEVGDVAPDAHLGLEPHRIASHSTALLGVRFDRC